MSSTVKPNPDDPLQVRPSNPGRGTGVLAVVVWVVKLQLRSPCSGVRSGFCSDFSSDIGRIGGLVNDSLSKGGVCVCGSVKCIVDEYIFPWLVVRLVR